MIFPRLTKKSFFWGGRGEVPLLSLGVHLDITLCLFVAKDALKGFRVLLHCGKATVNCHLNTAQGYHSTTANTNFVGFRLEEQQVLVPPVESGHQSVQVHTLQSSVFPDQKHKTNNVLFCLFVFQFKYYISTHSLGSVWVSVLNLKLHPPEPKAKNSIRSYNNMQYESWARMQKSETRCDDLTAASESDSAIRWRHFCIQHMCIHNTCNYITRVFCWPASPWVVLLHLLCECQNVCPFSLLFVNQWSGYSLIVLIPDLQSAANHHRHAPMTSPATTGPTPSQLPEPTQLVSQYASYHRTTGIPCTSIMSVMEAVWGLAKQDSRHCDTIQE